MLLEKAPLFSKVKHSLEMEALGEWRSAVFHWALPGRRWINRSLSGVNYLLGTADRLISKRINRDTASLYLIYPAGAAEVITARLSGPVKAGGHGAIQFEGGWVEFNFGALDNCFIHFRGKEDE